MNELLGRIRTAYEEILGQNLTGIYVHGSIAFGCFRREVSDVDFLAVVEEPLTLPTKKRLIQTLLELEPLAPAKGVEMSVVLAHDCRPFVYPTPFELHYSITHRERALRDLDEYCRHMNGTDPDLAAHCTVTRAVGQTLCGRPIDEVFGEVPKAAYLDSLRYDVENAAEDVRDHPVYVLLNLCRVLAFVREDRVLSKQEGGQWGFVHLPQYREIIQSALQAYISDTPYQPDEIAEQRFITEALQEIQ